MVVRVEPDVGLGLGPGFVPELEPALPALPLPALAPGLVSVPLLPDRVVLTLRPALGLAEPDGLLARGSRAREKANSVRCPATTVADVVKS
jgi:hypothetical protein